MNQYLSGSIMLFKGVCAVFQNADKGWSDLLLNVTILFVKIMVHL